LSNFDRAVPALLALLLAGCIGEDDRDDAKDRDNDGYLAAQAGGDDCNDEDASVHPGADEVCGDGVDNDCDTLVDDDGINAETFYPDADGDTWGADAPVSACTRPAGHVDRGGDCNDGDLTVHPEATEEWYDGTDQDCDGADDYDQDQDGYASAVETEDGLDCDDTEPTVNPDATELCGNLRDDDCDGTHNDCDWSTATWATVDATRIVHEVAEETPHVTVGDVEDDGDEEILAWAPDSGEFYLHFSPWSTGTPDLEDDALLQLSLAAPPSGYDHVATLEQDLTGDGKADLVVGTWSLGTRGAVRAWDGLEATAGSPVQLDVGDAVRTYQGPEDGSETEDGFGSTLVPLGVVPGASNGSIVVPYRTTALGSRCLVFHDAPVSGAADVVATLAIDTCGTVVAWPLNASTTVALVEVDASHHLVDPTPGTPVNAPDAPEALLFSGSVNADVLRNAPDMDGDGDTEVLILELLADPAVFRMPFGPINAASPPGRTLTLTAGTDIEDFIDAHTGDFNGDGALDLVLLADADDSDGAAGGTAVLVLFGPVEFLIRTWDTDDYDAALHFPAGETAWSLHPADVDGDGYTDLVLPGPGGIHVVYGQGW